MVFYWSENHAILSWILLCWIEMRYGLRGAGELYYQHHGCGALRFLRYLINDEGRKEIFRVWYCRLNRGRAGSALIVQKICQKEERSIFWFFLLRNLMTTTLECSSASVMLSSSSISTRIWHYKEFNSTFRSGPGVLCHLLRVRMYVSMNHSAWICFQLVNRFYETLPANL